MCYLLTPNTCARVHVCVCVCVPRSRHVFRAGEAGFIDYFGIVDGHKPEPPHHKQPKVRSSGMLQEEADYLTARARAMREWKPTRSRRIRDRWFGGEAPPVEQETGFLEDWRARATARPTFQVVHNKAEAGVGVWWRAYRLCMRLVPRADSWLCATSRQAVPCSPSEYPCRATVVKGASSTAHSHAQLQGARDRRRGHSHTAGCGLGVCVTDGR